MHALLYFIIIIKGATISFSSLTYEVGEGNPQPIAVTLTNNVSLDRNFEFSVTTQAGSGKNNYIIRVSDELDIIFLLLRDMKLILSMHFNRNNISTHFII